MLNNKNLFDSHDKEAKKWFGFVKGFMALWFIVVVGLLGFGVFVIYKVLQHFEIL